MSKCLIYVENIRKALVELDPPNAATYNNAYAYSQKIKDIDQDSAKRAGSDSQTNATWSVVKAHSRIWLVITS